MNPIIAQYFDTIEVWLIQSPVVLYYQVIRREITPIDGKLRIKISLSDGGMLEFFEYVIEAGGNIQLSKYSFHWQDAQRQLKKRWNNAPHHPALPNSSHHVHLENDTVQSMIKVPDIFYVIKQIEEMV